jgi:hypothetical protein
MTKQIMRVLRTHEPPRELSLRSGRRASESGTFTFDAIKAWPDRLMRAVRGILFVLMVFVSCVTHGSTGPDG